MKQVTIRQIRKDQTAGPKRSFGLSRRRLATLQPKVAAGEFPNPFNSGFYGFLVQALVGLGVDQAHPRKAVIAAFRRLANAGATYRSRVCDNASGQAGLSLVIDLIRDWQSKLAAGGVLLLWQASGPLHREIHDAVEQFNWELTGPIVWDKGRLQPGDLGSAYSRQTEILWVLSRPGDDQINHDGSSRSDILRFRPVSFPGLAGQQDHCFEKPVDMCEFLINKHSHRGEMVLDLCGCTASLSLAAIKTGRQWMYVESNLQNYQLGAGRIARRLAKSKAW